ncbi:copper chaperone [Enterococcus sp. PF1-24]|uniref:copper chaperone CopZ n=1 Tax=unclassified Enterococcus TaxID=2608891 RepID=UPI0024772D1D|nr:MULTISPECIES: copper chaperone CopZ [unclassified Enterococcus]MDH6365295.1 copper chaperone [Enterococcus sp. PFB1-1]MDH6402375.1 copper chaperone [Enterococcus sp. PF1-24]
MKQTFSIKGMSCQHCVARVEEGIKSLAGIQKVKINLKKENGVVKFDESQVTPQQIAEKITETGFTAEVM